MSSNQEHNAARKEQPVKRWSARAKQEVVLEILRGEPMEELSRRHAVEMHRLQEWRDRALAGVEEAMKEHGRNTASERALEEARSTIGRLTMELEIFRGKGRRSLR